MKAVRDNMVGGKRMNYQEHLNTKHWRRIRKRALNRAGHRCQVCSEKKGLNVHHNNYDRVAKERMSDLVVLCRECHKLYHGIMPKSKLRIPPIGDLANLKRLLHI